MERVESNRLDVQRPFITVVVDHVRRVIPPAQHRRVVVAYHAALPEDLVALRVWRVVAVGACAEVGRLVHVEPETVEGDDAMEVSDFLSPPFLRIRVEEVGDVARSWPHLRNVAFAVAGSVEQEHVQFVSSNVCYVGVVYLDTWRYTKIS